MPVGGVSSILLALAASLVWGAGDFLGGFASRTSSAVVVLLTSQLCSLMVVAIVIVVARPVWPGLHALWPALAGGAGWGVGIVALYRALAIGPMSVVAPLLTLTAPVTVCLGLVSGDRPSVAQTAGMALVVAGLAWTAGAAADRSGDARRRRAPVATVLAVLAALVFGGNFAALHAAVDGSVVFALLLVRASGVVVLALTALVTRPRLTAEVSDVVRSPAVVVGVGLLDLLGVTCFAVANARGMLSVAGVLATLYPAVTVALAGLVLDERMTSRQFIGACCC